MLQRKRIKTWFSRHIASLTGHPTNGKTAMIEMDNVLREISKEKRRIRNSVEQSKAEVAAYQEIITDNNDAITNL